MKSQQPIQCERCGAKLQIDGVPCYQRNCDYYKADETPSDGDVMRHRRTKKEKVSQQNIDYSEKEQKAKVENKSDLNDLDLDVYVDTDGDGIVDTEVSQGCLWGILKVIWKILSFPFKLILRIISIFD